ncbi:serine/threonine-protein kinase [Polyangium aurulentum]|uniref:serine/threonine-protein kinase n=1 Tax=Polyangium aurulentum TaxID=2567896 RepID=UPI00146B2E0E|nr:serine/threonine-protein kinase [Polyangium aurulentum]UQA55612.1 serine/threonine protein kinase [Polyangium aurulentum]
MDLAPGSIIAGRYRVDQRVGAGGMGEVWAGEHLAIGMKVAIKTLLAAAAYDREVVARFRREANLLGRIRSDHVARVVDFVEDPAVGLVLVMEFIEGNPLSKVLQQRRLSVEEAIEIGTDVLSALVDLHRAHVIHRDMKPGNIIMMPKADGRYRAIIVDFGMGRIASNAGEDLEQTNLTRADMALGTLEYMAPEQILNSRDVTAASDLYAVGALLYRAVAGRHIYGDALDAELARAKLMQDAQPLQTGRNDRIAQGFVQVVMKGVKRRPQERYQRADEMLAAMKELRDAVHIAALEKTNARHLVAPPSIPPSQQAQAIAQQQAQVPAPRVSYPSMSQQGYPVMQQHPGYPAMQTGNYPAHSQSYPGMAPGGMPGGERQSRPSAPTTLSSSGAAPISVPVPQQRRGFPVAAVLIVLLLALAGGGIGGAFFMQKRLGGSSASQPTAPTAAPAAPPAPPPTTAPAAVATASSAPLNVEDLDPEVEPTAAPPAGASARPGTTPSVAGPMPRPSAAAAGAPSANKAPSVDKIKF